MFKCLLLWLQHGNQSNEQSRQSNSISIRHFLSATWYKMIYIGEKKFTSGKKKTKFTKGYKISGIKKNKNEFALIIVKTV